MSFTQDELQSFNVILEQKLSVHRRELERTFDQRLLMMRREFDQRLSAVQQDLLRALSQRLTDQQRVLKETMAQRVDLQQTRNSQELSRALLQRQQQQQHQFESFVERALAAQLLAVEQLMNQHLPQMHSDFSTAYSGDSHPDFEAIEVQTEIPWEDLGQAFSKVLDERLSALNDVLQVTLKNSENYLSTLLLTMRDAGVHSPLPSSYTGNITNLQELFHSIEQLEQIIESMQVAMTANHALLSNRLYHHQQLPLERAHPRSQSTSASETLANGTKGPLKLAKESENTANNT